MRAAEQAALARFVETALSGGDAPRAAGAVLDVLGAELFGFLVSILDDHRAARVAYAALGERIARELPRFSTRCALRVWAYGLARRELALFQTPGGARPPSTLPSPRAPRAVRAAMPYRSVTLASVAPTLRRNLSLDDRQLLVLRINRRLTWRELAIAWLGEVASERRLLSEAEALRRRFARIRDAVVRAATSLGVAVR